MISLENDIMERTQALGLPETAYMPSCEELADTTPETQWDAVESRLGTIPEASEESDDSEESGEYPNSAATPLLNRIIRTYSQPDPSPCNYADISIANHPNLKAQMNSSVWRIFKEKWDIYSESTNWFHETWLKSLSLVGCVGTELGGRFGRFFSCRTRIGSQGAYSCGDAKLCEYCAYKRKKELVAKYRHLLPKGRWDHLTIGFEAFPGHLKGVQGIHDHWDACRDVVKRMVGNGMVEGVLLQEEISLKDLYPRTLVNPHCHAICFNLDTSADTKEWIAKGVTGYLNEYNDRLDDEPNIDVIPIKGQDDFENKLSYIRKPTDFVMAYESGIATCIDDGRDFSLLNRRLKEYLDLLWRVQDGRTHSHSYGCLHTNTSNSLVPRRTRTVPKKKPKSKSKRKK